MADPKACFTGHYAKLTSAIAGANPLIIAQELVQKNLVGEYIVGDVTSARGRHGQATCIMMGVEALIGVDGKAIYSFIEVLDKSGGPACKVVTAEMKIQLGIKSPPGGKSLDAVDTSPAEMLSPGAAGAAQKTPTREVETEGGEGKGSAHGSKVSKFKYFYEMNTGHHGVALVMNNIEWERGEDGVPLMSRRDGAKEDAEALMDSLQQLGFQVIYKENLTAEKMKKKLEKVRNESIRPTDDSSICCVLSHGGAAGIYGTDGKIVTAEELGEILEPAADKCPVLRNKPKIFFIQACRGDEASEPVDTKEQPMPKVPRGADYYFSYCTDPGHVALRSAYPQFLSETLVKNHSMSLDEIVMDVHRQLAEKLTKVCVQQKVKPHLQIGQVVHTLRGPVYFQ